MLTEEPASGRSDPPPAQTPPPPETSAAPHAEAHPPLHVGPGSAVPPAAQPLQGRRAGMVTRGLADAVDFAVVAGILGVIYLGVAAARFIWRSWTFSFPTPSFLLVLVVGTVVSVLYLTAAWGTTGRSYGKHVLGLRVVGPFGRLRVAGAFVRAVLCVIFPVGLAWVLVSRHNRSLQDVVLRTSVVYDWLGEANTSAGAEEQG